MLQSSVKAQQSKKLNILLQINAMNRMNYGNKWASHKTGSSTKGLFPENLLKHKGRIQLLSSLSACHCPNPQMMADSHPPDHDTQAVSHH